MHEIRHGRVSSGGVGLHVARAGMGPPVVLLHGFPESWRSWRHQVRPLVEAGFCALMPDLRGYGRSDAPQEVAAYAPNVLVNDVVAILRAFEARRAHIVGHDWGGVIAWWLAAAYPELVDRLVIINAPHPAILKRQLRRPRQLARSWYTGFFQLPRLPELTLRAFDCAAVRRLLRTTPARPKAFRDEDIECYIGALQQRGRLTAALNYYRAGLRYGDRAPRPVRTTAPTLIIWGERDVALTTALLDDVPKYAPNARIARLPDVGHWAQNEAPIEVNRLLIESLTG